MSPRSLIVAVGQFAPVADRRANRERAVELVAVAAARGARLVVLPEYASYFVNPMDESLAANAETIDGEFVSAIRRAATEHRIVIVSGLLERADAERSYSTVVAVTDAGVVAVHRKQYLYDAFGGSESDWLRRGEIADAAVLDVDGVRFGLMNCYDVRFPEVARTLVDAGAEVMIVPAEWVRGPLKEHHWKTLLAARAIENTVYVLAADHPGSIGVGLSQVIDPQGVVVAGVSAGEGVAVAEIDGRFVERTREVNPVLRLRRHRVVPAP